MHTLVIGLALLQAVWGYLTLTNRHRSLANRARIERMERAGGMS